MELLEKQYFTEADFLQISPSLKIIKEVTLHSTDTYDESEIAKSVRAIGIETCGAIALQLAIMGLGKKTYGKCSFNDKEIDIKDFFQKNDVKCDANLGSMLKPSDLTPRRLIRFFRFLTRDFIKSTGKSSYLFRKYCPVQEMKWALSIYPGFEHMAEPEHHKDEVVMLINTYKILDSRQIVKTNITERIIRVLLAKGFSWEFLTKI